MKDQKYNVSIHNNCKCCHIISVCHYFHVYYNPVDFSVLFDQLRALKHTRTCCYSKIISFVWLTGTQELHIMPEVFYSLHDVHELTHPHLVRLRNATCCDAFRARNRLA